MITFKIIEYTDGTLRIETSHIAYHFRDGLFYDNVNRKDLIKVMTAITDVMNNKYNEAAVFEIA